MGEELDRRKAVIWMNKEGFRYVPRATKAPAWAVWDNKDQRFVGDEELLKLSFEDTQERWLQ